MIKAPAPVSFNQQRLWFFEQLNPGSPVYNTPLAYRVTGQLNVMALEQSLGEIVRHHEALRTTFATVDGKPVQVISPEVSLTMPLVDLQEVPQQQRQAKAARVVTEEAQRPVDLAQGSLLRVKLLRLSEQEHVLLLVLHHIVCDDLSLSVFVQELAALYEAFSTGKPSPLPELPIQYADFAVWQRQQLQGEVLESQLDYWKQQLGGSLSPLELPTDYPRPLVQTYRGARQSLELPKNLKRALRALSQREGVSLFMTLLTAFKALLYRYTDQEDIIVGSPIANRNRGEVEGLIGFFVNTLVMRTYLGDNPSFRELLSRVREVVLGAYAHQDLPFEKLVEELQPKRDLSRSPLFQVMFAFQDAQMPVLELSSLTLKPLEIDNQTAEFDLTLSLVETEQGLTGFFEYNTDLFDATTITRMLGHFQTMLAGVAADPNKCLCDLPLLTPAERHQLLVEWNDTQTDYPKDACIHQLFEAQVERTPDAPAVVFEDSVLTYRELNCRANCLAHHLQKLGVGPEVLVGICVERSLEMVFGLLGILKAGGAYVPLDPVYPQERLAFMLEDAQVPVLLTQQRFVEGFPKSRVKIICLDSDWEGIDSTPSKKASPTGIASLPALESQENPASEVTADNLAYVIYTSGSTGKPKGVAVPHRAVNRLVFNTNYVNLKPSDKVAQASNASFDAATFEIWGALLNGAKLVGITKDVTLSPQKFAAYIREQEISVLFLTTALFNQLASLVPSVFSSVQHLLFGGEAVDPRWVKEVLLNGPPRRLLHVYGPTENTTFSSWYLVKEVPEAAVTLPIGGPISNTQIYLLDRHLQPVPVGVPGELYIGGDGLARGYLNRPELTEEKFIANSYPSGNSEKLDSHLYKTGDLARYLPDGNIEFLGRIDNQVKIRGFRIELGEIERVLSQHTNVREVVVLAREDEPGFRRLVAYIVANQNSTYAQSEYISFLQEQLPDYMVPSAFVILEALPLTPNGKVDRRVLPAPSSQRPQLEQPYVAPQSDLERLLERVWSALLKIDRVGIHDNFFDLGGNSLLSLQVASQVQQLGIELPVVKLFQNPTIASLAKYLSPNQGNQPSYDQVQSRAQRQKAAHARQQRLPRR